MTTPTQRTLAELRKNGYIAQVVEHWNAFAHIRQDLFGFIDVVAIKPGINGVLGIQTTSTGNISERIKKIQNISSSTIWIEAGNKLEVWGWSKKGKVGKRKLWTLTKRELYDQRFELKKPNTP